MCARVCVSVLEISLPLNTKMPLFSFQSLRRQKIARVISYMLLHFSHSIENGFRSNQMCAQRKEIYLKSFFFAAFHCVGFVIPCDRDILSHWRKKCNVFICFSCVGMMIDVKMMWCWINTAFFKTNQNQFQTFKISILSYCSLERKDSGKNCHFLAVASIAFWIKQHQTTLHAIW